MVEKLVQNAIIKTIVFLLLDVCKLKTTIVCNVPQMVKNAPAVFPTIFSWMMMEHVNLVILNFQTVVFATKPNMNSNLPVNSVIKDIT